MLMTALSVSGAYLEEAEPPPPNSVNIRSPVFEASQREAFSGLLPVRTPLAELRTLPQTPPHIVNVNYDNKQTYTLKVGLMSGAVQAIPST